MKKIILVLQLLLYSNSYSVPKKILFDATKAETAGNADWVIDEDNHTALRFPIPDQSGITSSTPENYWTGALSSWEIAENYEVNFFIEGLLSRDSFYKLCSGNFQQSKRMILLK